MGLVCTRFNYFLFQVGLRFLLKSIVYIKLFAKVTKIPPKEWKANIFQYFSVYHTIIIHIHQQNRIKGDLTLKNTIWTVKPKKTWLNIQQNNSIDVFLLSPTYMSKLHVIFLELLSKLHPRVSNNTLIASLEKKEKLLIIML